MGWGWDWGRGQSQRSGSAQGSKLASRVRVSTSGRGQCRWINDSLGFLVMFWYLFPECTRMYYPNIQKMKLNLSAIQLFPVKWPKRKWLLRHYLTSSKYITHHSTRNFMLISKMYTPFFYKNPFYKNHQAQNWPKFKNIVRIIIRPTILWVCVYVGVCECVWV